MDDFRAPNRKPWLMLIVVVLVGLFVIHRVRARRAAPAAPAQEHVSDTARSNVIAHAPAEELPRGQVEPTAPALGADDLLRRAHTLETNEEFSDAREAYLELLEKYPLTRTLRADVERTLGKLNSVLVLSPLAMAEKVEYVVKRGDSVERIANRFGTTVDLIQQSNQIQNANLIKAGDRLRIFAGKFSLEISKRSKDMIVTLNGRFFKRFSVGTGKFDKTPAGTFTLTEKIKEPVWWRPDGKEVPFGTPENILGTRWMTLRATGETPDVRGYGIHGTWEDASIGKAESAGCIRMRNGEVEELYALVPVGTPVVIVE